MPVGLTQAGIFREPRKMEGMVSKRTPTKKSISKRDGTERKTPPSKKEASPEKAFTKETGSTDVRFQTKLINQALDVLLSQAGTNRSEQLSVFNSISSMLGEIKPQDGLEGMLAVQMVSTHNIAMDCFRRAMHEAATVPTREQDLKHATKLLSLFNQQLGTLNKHCGKGQQKVTVEHVNVEAGGKAIVGNVDASKARQKEKSKDSDTRALTYEPGETLDNLAIRSGRTIPTKHRERQLVDD